MFDDAFVSQTEVDGWCILSDGKDTLRVGYVAVVDPASGVLVLPDNGFSSVKVRNFGPSLGWAEGFTLAKLGGEEQNRTYGSIAAIGFRRADPNSPLYGGLRRARIRLRHGAFVRAPVEPASSTSRSMSNGDGASRRRP